MRLANPFITSFWVCILVPFLSFSQSNYQFDNFQTGKQYHQRGDLKTAIIYYSKTLAENSTDTKALFNRGIAYYQMENFESAKSDFENLVALQPNDMEGLQNLATIEFMMGHFVDALTHYDVIAQQRPTGEIYGQRALVKTYLQLYPEALSDLNTAIQYDPNNPLNYVHQGDIYSAIEQYEQAIHAYSQAINLRVEDADVFNNRANAKVSLGAYQEAIYDYNNAILLKRESHFFSNRANCHIYLGKPEATIADAREALRLDPDNDKAYYFMGLANLNEQYYEEALSAFNQAIRLNDQDGEYYGQRGVAQYMMQHFQAAMQDFEQAVTINPDLSESYRLLEMTQAEVAYRPELTQVEISTPTDYYLSDPVNQPVDNSIRSRSIYPYVPPMPEEERFETGRRMF
jgi:tetratricopeptide (TPR) repeat protein